MEVQEAYRNIEKIITYGFLTVGMSFDGFDLILKNITDSEQERFEYYALKDSNRTEMLVYQLIMSTFMVNGVNVLGIREKAISVLHSFYVTLPNQLVAKIVDILKELNEQYLDTLQYLEGYCYTERSRYLWNSVGINGFFRSLSGVEGVESTGINQIQQVWLLINKQLDDEAVYHREFNLSVMVASSLNSKGAKTVQRVYETKRTELDELRKDIATYGYDKKRLQETRKRNQWTMPIKSREDLVRELYRQMTGQKDMHDLFIEKWIDRKKKAAEEAKKRAEERQSTFRKEFEEVDLTQLEPSRPVSLEEIQKLKTKKTGQEYMSSYEHMDTQDRYIKKISARVIRPTSPQKR